MNLLLFGRKKLTAGISLALDFRSGILDSRITFTRTSAGSRVNQNGLLETVSSNQPRFDYDPVTLAPKGLLIEEQRANLLTWSEQFDNATGWVYAAPYSVTPNTITGPDGATTADAIILASGSTSFNTNVPRQVITKAASAIQYTHSCYIKAKGAATSVRIVDFGSTTANSALVIVSLIDGSIISAPSVTGTFTGASVVVESLQNGWFRVALTYTSDTATTLTVRHFPYNGSTQLVGDGVSGLYLWGAQLEAGAFPTSYIPTTSASVTRAADNASMTGTNFSSWYRQDEGTMVCSSDCFGQTLNFPSVWWTDDGTLNNYLAEYYYSNIMGATQRANTISYGDINCVGTINPLSINKSAYSYRTNDSAISVNGSALTGIAVDNTITLPLLSRFNIGAKGGASNYLNGHIQSIRYYPRRLADSDLQRLTR